jgi:hypothetical protein
VVLERRLTRIERTLDPEAAALRWLDEAQAHPSLQEHLLAMEAGPRAEHPLVAIPKQLREAVREARKGDPTTVLERAAKSAIREAVFHPPRHRPRRGGRCAPPARRAPSPSGSASVAGMIVRIVIVVAYT